MHIFINTHEQIYVCVLFSLKLFNYAQYVIIPLIRTVKNTDEKSENTAEHHKTKIATSLTHSKC